MSRGRDGAKWSWRKEDGGLKSLFVIFSRNEWGNWGLRISDLGFLIGDCRRVALVARNEEERREGLRIVDWRLGIEDLGNAMACSGNKPFTIWAQVGTGFDTRIE